MPDVLNLAIPTLTGGQPEATPAATIGGLNDPSIPNGEINDPAPLTSALPPGETGTATPATTAIVPSIASVHPSFISGCGVPFVSSAHTSNDYMSSASQIDLFDHHGPFEHGHGDDGDGDRFKKTSSITITTETTFYSLTEISGTPTSIPIKETITTVLPTVVPAHSHKSPNRSATPNSGLTQLDDDMPLTVFFKVLFP